MAFKALRQASGSADLNQRRSGLTALSNALREAAEDFAAAIDADFEGHPRTETMLSEISMLLESISWKSRRLRRWMRPECSMLSPEFWPSRGRCERVPFSVVGILSP